MPESALIEDREKSDSKIHYPDIRQAIWLLVIVFLLASLLSIPVAVIGDIDNPASIAVINLMAIGIVLKRGLKKINVPIKNVFPCTMINTSFYLPMFFTVVGMGILLSEIDNLFQSVFPAPKFLTDIFVDIASGQTSLWGSALFLVIVAPLTEELLFRGFILHGFLSHYTVRKSILASAILFGLFHINPWQLTSTIILGIIFAWWFVRTGSLLPCLFGHALHNSIPLIVMRIFPQEIKGLTTLPSKGIVEFQPLWLDFTGLILAGLGLWILTRMFRDTEVNPHEDSLLSESGG
ncbi:lysostaphin resistance A-like protein [Candidatus Omnitrophota bacterium]